jgi:hypothetical protein
MLSSDSGNRLAAIVSISRIRLPLQFKLVHGGITISGIVNSGSLLPLEIREAMSSGKSFKIPETLLKTWQIRRARTWSLVTSSWSCCLLLFSLLSRSMRERDCCRSCAHSCSLITVNTAARSYQDTSASQTKKKLDLWTRPRKSCRQHQHSACTWHCHELSIIPGH